MLQRLSRSDTHLRFAVLATDTALFTLCKGELMVRLVKVNRPPHYKGVWGLPGGLIRPEETAEETSIRILEEKGGIPASKAYIEQLYTFSALRRDPRGRVVAVAYLALVPWEDLSAQEKADTDEVCWRRVQGAHGLAYDHDDILSVARARLRSRATYTTVLSKVMPSEFTLTELEKAYEAVLKTDLDKRNFRKKILKVGILKDLGRKRISGHSRPAALYRFASPTVRHIEVI